MDDFSQTIGSETTRPLLPMIIKIMIGMTLLNTLIILFIWPGMLLRVCF